MTHNQARLLWRTLKDVQEHKTISCELLDAAIDIIRGEFSSDNRSVVRTKQEHRPGIVEQQLRMSLEMLDRDEKINRNDHIRQMMEDNKL